MPRIRYLKAEFFTDHKLGALTPLARILFQGLWVWADREGRLEDCPPELKVKILPFDSCEIEDLLGDLAEAGRIIRYDSEGLRLIEIPNFSKHKSSIRRSGPPSSPLLPP